MTNRVEISFVVPAHNEEAELGATLQAIHDAAAALDRPYEIVVADDSSTDRTAEIARESGARVVPVQHRQIAKTRNSGGRAAVGKYIFFIDADTHVNARTVAASLRALEGGAAGGGATVWLDGPIPLWVGLLTVIGGVLSKAGGVCGGAFMFATREAFLACGGFDEKLFCSEEISFATALKKHGRFVVVWPKAHSSGRRFRTVTGSQYVKMALRIFAAPFRFFRHRAEVQAVWYDSNRSHDNVVRDQWIDRILNAFAFIILAASLTTPIWTHFPWSWTPQGTLLYYARLTMGVLVVHLGLIWIAPTQFYLLRWFRQPLNYEWVKYIVLILICGGMTAMSLHDIIEFWRGVFSNR